MVRVVFFAVGLSSLAGCAVLSAPRPAVGLSWQASESTAQGFRFDWRLSGDPAVAPMQVFDDGRDIWLQFAPDQPLPAIFGVGPDGERVLPYLHREPYVVLAGGWNALLFRGGRLSAKARRGPDSLAADAVAVAPDAPLAPPCRAASSCASCRAPSTAQAADKPL